MKDDDMVDLEQFRDAVKCWRRSAAACGSSDDVKEADRLLSIIDSAEKVEAKREAHQPAAVDGAWETAAPDLYNEISSVLNKHSAESGSNTPDYVLAQFLLESMTAFNAATNRRDAHYNGSAIAGGAK